MFKERLCKWRKLRRLFKAQTERRWGKCSARACTCALINFFFFKRYRKQGKGKFSQGKGGTKTCDDSSIGSCVRASVTEARVTVYVCVHMPRECVCERKDVHAYCSKMLAAQQKQDYALAELNYKGRTEKEPWHLPLVSHCIPCQWLEEKPLQVTDSTLCEVAG